MKPSIGNRKSPREIAADTRLEDALLVRRAVFAGFEQPEHGSGTIAVAVNGRHIIMHLGRDEVDAKFGLAALMLRPEGRS